MCGEAGQRASGLVGVPPAVFRVPRNTPEGRWHTERLCSPAGCRAGRALRQAGRLPCPRPALPLSVRLFAKDGISSGDQLDMHSSSGVLGAGTPRHLRLEPRAQQKCHLLELESGGRQR